ncbi:MAG: hypothetical protein MGG37_14125 [Trichodesmium sp. MAG_R01]|nr:hypothetical protein [Trichodesmium sp. MAG_R01]
MKSLLCLGWSNFFLYLAMTLIKIVKRSQSCRVEERRACQLPECEGY